MRVFGIMMLFIGVFFTGVLIGNPEMRRELRTFESSDIFWRGKVADRSLKKDKLSSPNREKIHFIRVEREAKGLVYRYIQEMCDDPDLPIPVPVEGIAKMLDLSIERSPMDRELAGQLLWKERKILVNSIQLRSRQRFTIAHEIGHFVLHASTKASFCQIRAIGREEREADYFAARMLMPVESVRDIREEILKLSPRRDPTELVILMADRFDVSRKAMQICLQEMRYLPRDEKLPPGREQRA